MFTGIIEELGKIIAIDQDKSNTHFTIESNLSKESYIDQSIAHNGVCLTVIQKDDASHTVTAIQETLDKTNIGQLKVGSFVNLERATVSNGRMDGHIVQGHVDGIAHCIDINELDGSWNFHFQIDSKDSALIVDKGSITINGVSLTICVPTTDTFYVAIIPYTFEHTNFKTIKKGDPVNIEFDIIGKYVARYMDSTRII